MSQRKAALTRTTNETNVKVALHLDKAQPVKISTTIPFLDHMLTLLSSHATMSLVVEAKGDTEIDDHHLAEDIGITLGQALTKALGDKKGISRYGNFLLPMDEALSYIALDISGRPLLDYEVPFKAPFVGFDYDLLQEFFYALAMNAKITLHISLKRGRNNHHIAESLFKGFAKALAQAISYSKRGAGIPSTKGVL